MAEVLLDSEIRLWVFLPIVIVTFLVGIIRHYVTVLLSSEKKVEIQKITDSQALIRSRMLRENGKYLPRESFYMRKKFFNDEENGFFKTQRRDAQVSNPMTAKRNAVFIGALAVRNGSHL